MMRAVFCSAVMLATLAPAVGAQDAPAAAKTSPVVVTMGRATVRVAPDRAFVTVATEAAAPSPAAAQQQIARAMSSVRAALRGAGIADEAVKTLAYGLQEDVDYPNGKRVVRGYRARNTIEVRVDDIARVGDTIDVAVKAGATTVADIRFDLKDRAAVERDALKRAVADARARAEAMAAGAGVSIGSILRIDEEGQPSPIPRPAPMMAMRAAAAEPAETPVSAGEIEVDATVTLTASIR